MRITVLDTSRDIEGAVSTWHRRGWEQFRTAVAKNIEPASVHLDFKKKVAAK